MISLKHSANNKMNKLKIWMKVQFYLLKQFVQKAVQLEKGLSVSTFNHRLQDLFILLQLAL